MSIYRPGVDGYKGTLQYFHWQLLKSQHERFNKLISGTIEHPRICHGKVNIKIVTKAWEQIERLRGRSAHLMSVE